MDSKLAKALITAGNSSVRQAGAEYQISSRSAINSSGGQSSDERTKLSIAAKKYHGSQSSAGFNKPWNISAGGTSTKESTAACKPSVGQSSDEYQRPLQSVAGDNLVLSQSEFIYDDVSKKGKKKMVEKGKAIKIEKTG